MGLDIVELIMEVEDTFDVTLEDDFSRIATVGDLHGVICAHHDAYRRSRATGGYPWLKPFFATRDAMVALADVPRRSIRPSALMSDLIPPEQRRDFREAFQIRTKIRSPPLHVLRPLAVFIWLAAGCSLAVSGYQLVNQHGPAVIIVVAFYAALVISGTYALTRPLAVMFPVSCRTVRDVVQRARPPAYPCSSLTAAAEDPELVWESLVASVSKVLCLPESEIHRHSRFIEDLKCG